MTAVAWANLYICANVLLALTAALLKVLGIFAGKLERPIAYKHRLAVGHALLVAAVLLPFAASVSDGEAVLPRTAQVWSAPTMNGRATDPAQDQRIALAVAPPGVSISLGVARDVAAAAVSIGLLISLSRLGRDIRRTRRIIAQAHTIRRRGRLSVRVSEHIDVPFSFWWPGRYVIAVPAALVLHPGDLKIAILHEGQHHRQQDTKWLYVYQLIKAMFFWNPAVHGLERQLRALQEFACDEAIAARKPIARAEYCRSLLRVAEAARFRHRAMLHASMTAGGAGLLERRVEAVLFRRASRACAPAVAAAMVGAALLAVAAACSSAIHDRRVSAEDAARMAAARAGTAFPVVVNDAVLRQLNRLLATPDGRAYLDGSFERLRSYEELIAGELASHGLPAELLAVPLVESGYRNLPNDGKPAHGAGLWMFIAPTARSFGLTVDEHRDERLDVAAATGAAMRYLGHLHRHFGDWGLAMLAYNAGAARVEEGIRATGSRDVWRIIAAGYENDPDYVPRVMAAVLILGSPPPAD